MEHVVVPYTSALSGHVEDGPVVSSIRDGKFCAYTASVEIKKITRLRCTFLRSFFFLCLSLEREEMYISSCIVTGKLVT